MFDRARFSGQINVGTTTTQVRPGNDGRRKIIFTNDGANVIYLMFQTADPRNPDATPNFPTAVASNGIRLNANGGSYVEEDYTGPISAIALTAATLLNVLEL